MVLNPSPEVANAKILVESIDWLVPDYKPSIEQQVILPEQIKGKTSTEIRYVERTVFVKNVKTQNLWSLYLRSQEGIDAPI